MPKDLRSYLAELSELGPSQCVEVDKEVDRIFQLPGIARALQEKGRYPAVLYNKVKDSPMRAVTNLVANRRQLAITMGSTEERMLQDYIEREDSRQPIKVVPTGPVKDVKLIGDDVDLNVVPIVWNCELDSGPFISGSQVVVKDPDTGVYNVGIFRMMVHSKNQLGIAFEKHADTHHILRKAEARNQPLEVIIFVGHHPATLLGTQTKTPMDIDSYEVIGGLLQEPFEVTPAETVDLNVPAWAEVVIEGKIPPHVRKTEAPYGEYTWYYGLDRESPVVDVSAITYRKDAIYHHMFAAHPEHNLCAVLGREAKVWKMVKPVVPTLKAVAMPISGLCRFTTYVSIRKEFDGQGKIAALAALASDPFIKLAVIVDDDVDVSSDRDVLWAIATRTQADKATFFVQDATVSRLDASAYSVWNRVEKDSLNTKWAIDTTRPVEAPFEEWADVPESFWRDLDLRQWVKGWTE
jgi:2,5-furandicarboxylate decarboxylase 1